MLRRKKSQSTWEECSSTQNLFVVQKPMWSFEKRTSSFEIAFVPTGHLFLCNLELESWILSCGFTPKWPTGSAPDQFSTSKQSDQFSLEDKVVLFCKFSFDATSLIRCFVLHIAPFRQHSRLDMNIVHYKLGKYFFKKVQELLFQSKSKSILQAFEKYKIISKDRSSQFDSQTPLSCFCSNARTFLKFI